MRKRKLDIRMWKPVAIQPPTGTRPNNRSFQKVLQIASSNQKCTDFRGWLKQQGEREELAGMMPPLEAFDWLVSKGCDPEELIRVLAALRTGYEYYWPKEPGRDRSPMRFDEQFGFDRHSLSTVLNRMKLCAADMEILLARLGRDEIQQAARAGPSFALELVNVPAQLRLFSGAVKTLSTEADLRSRPLYDKAIEALMRLVIRGTGQEQYSKVAALVAAVRESYYDPAALRNWWTKRRRHK